MSRRWQAWRAAVDLDEYDRRWERLARAGHDVHGEADAVARLGGRRILDAGCGTGRVAVELARRGFDVVGVDKDEDMLDRARAKSDAVVWVPADLAEVDLGRRFDVVVMAGSVLEFVEPGVEQAVVATLARHLAREGRLLAGFRSQPGCSVELYDEWCGAAGLALVERWSTWEGAAYDGGPYAVSVHQREGGAP